MEEAPIQERLKAKICLVGEQAVGKTSLIRRFVLDEYEDRYLTTVGTRVSKKEMWITFPGRPGALAVDLQIWDIMGEPDFRGTLRDAYFAGAQGILAVCDLTRRDSLDRVLDWIDLADSVAEGAAWFLVANKADLASEAAFGDADLRQIADVLRCGFLQASAKSGHNVQEAFAGLTRSVFLRLFQPRPPSTG